MHVQMFWIYRPTARSEERTMQTVIWQLMQYAYDVWPGVKSMFPLVPSFDEPVGCHWRAVKGKWRSGRVFSPGCNDSFTITSLIPLPSLTYRLSSVRSKESRTDVWHAVCFWPFLVCMCERERGEVADCCDKWATMMRVSEAEDDPNARSLLPHRSRNRIKAHTDKASSLASVQTHKPSDQTQNNIPLAGIYPHQSPMAGSQRVL
ncbi:uncharacterized protein EV422DRAFT_182847 [Fimicolochytrium jonesii]|uniref:uncharacterized protein n=1 Tax=Fimicolochytrium jonesii TaxID=1396493 RepID=UPI0022FF3242|nr:uncharacterized protein EV422DRAFT_182847 [Fimicolochytrium jonesii]KAI8818370.1 hypothetical protein EV422DRAFT_182847 [Fimicolochytrium jonesii]